MFLIFLYYLRQFYTLKLILYQKLTKNNLDFENQEKFKNPEKKLQKTCSNLVIYAYKYVLLV